MNYLFEPNQEFLNSLDPDYTTSYIKFDLKILGDISESIFEKPRIASYVVTREEKLSPFFDHVTNSERTYFILAEAEIIDRLISEDESDKISLVENDNKLRNIRINDILFLFEQEDTANTLSSTIRELELDVTYYNFMWTTFEEDINGDKLFNAEYSRTVDQDRIRFDEVIISNNSLVKDYENVLMRYKRDDNEFDFSYKRAINVIAAQTGNLKSTLTNNIVAAFANPTNDLGFIFLDDDRIDGQIVVFDTETNENHLAQKWDFYTEKSDKVDYITLKNISTHQRLDYLNSVLRILTKSDKTIRAIIIDSLIDFISDFNNIEESHRLIENILNITNQYDIPIFVTFQENPARYNGAYNKLSGHLGSKLSQKAESHYKTSVKGNMAEITCVKNRNETQFTLTYDLNSSGDFLILENARLKDKTKKSSDKKLDKLKRYLDIAFAGKKSLSNTELTIWIMETLGIKKRAACDWKQKLEDEDLIKKIQSSGRTVEWVKK